MKRLWQKIYDRDAASICCSKWYADGMSCTCASCASAGSLLTSPSAAICAFLESGTCGCEGVRTESCVAECGLREQRVLVMGITLHHGCWNAKHVWVSSESASSGDVISVFARAAVSCSRATVNAACLCCSCWCAPMC